MFLSSDVAIVRGNERRQNIRRALELIDDQIHYGQRIVVKPNLTSVTNPLAVSHAEALDEILKFIKERTDNQVTVAEGCATTNTLKGLATYGMVEVAKRYGAKLVDLNRDKWVEVELVDRDLRPMTLRFARTVAESDFRISLTPMKTHDVVIITLSLKNLVMGSLIRKGRDNIERLTYILSHLLRPRNALFPRSFYWAIRHILCSDKVMMHQTHTTMNYNLFLLARVYPAHLAVLDGFTAMEGRGPTKGTPVKLRLAVASTDFIAADSVGAHIMGFDPSTIGYLYHAISYGLGEGDLEKIQILGDSLEKCARPFKPHPNFAVQQCWGLPKLESLRGSLK